MIQTFKRSWNIFKLCLRLIGQDKEMIWFPVLSGFFSLLLIIAFAVPTIFAIVAETITSDLAFIQYIVVFLLYLGLAFIATFFNVALVNTIKTRIEGGDATFKDSIHFALARIGVIFKWSMLSATVGLLLRILEGMARNQKGAGRIIAQLLVSMLGLAWAVATVFVIPVIAYQNKGPIDAIKGSIEILKKTWGESLIRHYGVGLIGFVVTAILVLFIVIPIGFLLTMTIGVAGIIIGIIFGIIVITAVSLFTGVVNQVFNIVLYEYATKGHVPGDFDKETLDGAFESKKQGI